MDLLENNRRAVRSVIEGYAKFRPSSGDVEAELIFDQSKDHYELMYSGWQGIHRVHGCVIHIDIRGDKVWIQYDGTEEGVAEDLVAAGIPRDRIVLGFKHPEVRPLTDYAAL